MNEKTQLKAFLLSLFIISAMALSQLSEAAIALVPKVDGYNSGSLKSSSGSYSMTAANDGYIKTTMTNVGGKPITVPAKMRMAANAGQLVKNALRLNPYLLIGAAALAYLSQNGIDLQNGSWVKAAPNTNGNGYLWHNGSHSGANCSSALLACTIPEAFEARKIRLTATFPGANSFSQISPTAPCLTTSCSLGLTYKQTATGSFSNDYTDLVRADLATSKLPATEADFNALPDPLPALAPELPFAPYMLEGAPVLPPEFDFVPFTTPLGLPYTRPDGSTVQPSAVVSPNGDGITVDTFDKPLTDPSGVPVASPQPQDTPEPAPKEEQQTQCDKYPDSLGCAKLDTLTPEAINKKNLDIALISPVSVGGVGTCPAPMTASFLGQNVEVAFTPLCIFADTLRPLVLAIAWLSAGLIFIGGVRNG